MSRIGNKPIPLPKGVTVTIGDAIAVKGPKGQLSTPLVGGVDVSVTDDVLTVTRQSDHRTHRANHGLIRALVSNMVTGVTAGFEKKLEIIGVGYKAENKGKNVVFNLGFSHPIDYTPPEGVTVTIDKGTKVSVKGINRESVGQAAAVIRGFRPPDSYKGKGVRYEGEHIRLKAGKAAKK
jgi:large subunit ribosomal protein L6